MHTQTKTTNNIISFSGGKDSTAMLHWMLDHGEPIHSVIHFDSGWEFPAMIEHINHVEKKTDIKIIRLKPEKPFTYYMFEKRVPARNGPMKGRVHRLGYGWPSRQRRWCNRIMSETISKYTFTVATPVHCIGVAADEQHRARDKRYPLIEYDKTSADCLKYCKKLGYQWDGLYNIFPRTSCYCCPLQSIGSLRNLRKHFPDLWNQMLEWDLRMTSNVGFKDYDTLINLECWFEQEDEKRSGHVKCSICNSKCFPLKTWQCPECGNIELNKRK